MDEGDPNPEHDLRATRMRDREVQPAPESFPQLPEGFDDPEPIHDRPTIQITTELHDTITESCSALAADRNVFARDGQLVNVIRCDEADADTYIGVGAPKIRIIAMATMRERLTRCATYVKADARRKNESVRCIPKDDVVSGVLHRGEYPGIRPIVGILEAPSMRPDGSLIQRRGYDQRTGYLYEPNATFDEIPEKPTQTDAAMALRTLLSVFADFPFAIDAGRTAAVAAILTILARPAITGAVPAFIVDASTRGTGKSLATDVIGVIATGRATAKMSWPADDVELEKVLGGYAVRGAMLVNFDNVVRPFGGGPLDRCLTAVDTVELRILGKTEVPEVLWRAVVLATGNNISLTGDTARRSLICRLESSLEHPEDREDFTHANLVQWCRSNRPRLVVAALTILRGWFVGGKQAGEGKRWGSFESWSEMIPRAITFAGGADPMGARPAATDQEEPEKAALIGILDGLPMLDTEGTGLAARDMVKLLYPLSREDRTPDGHDALRDSIESLVPGTKAPTSKTLGNALRKLKHRVVGGRCLDSRAAGQHRVVWVVR